MPKGCCDLPNIAKSLAVGERTLQRRLQEEGTTFDAVHDEARHGLALSYLRDRTLGLGEVAWLLGFADLPSFYRAFRRWTEARPATTARALVDRRRRSLAWPLKTTN